MRVLLTLSHSPLLPILILSNTSISHATCECGYRLHDTHAYFTHALKSSFADQPDARSLNDNAPAFARDWTVQSWTANATKTNPIGRVNRDENVEIVDGQLVLRQQAYSAADAKAMKGVGVGAIVSKRDDFLHGSFRTTFGVDGAKGGAVAGFFWYHDDKNEIDIEVLTKEPNDTMIHYTSHPVPSTNNPLSEFFVPAIVPNGINHIPDASSAEPLTKPWTTTQEHRFDWTRDGITFYQGARTIHTMTVNIPKVGGSLQFNLWASGSEWSGPPSTQNVSMRVYDILVFYNTSASDAGTDEVFNRQCSAAGIAACSDLDPVVSGGSGLRARWSVSEGVSMVVSAAAFVLWSFRLVALGLA
ncbi:MAG: hypothetical protein M1825_000406 [Sarcosagium campestre]|nr:MAG: hypothetical protein M1825_000406 [Sarcosagium campestre]